MKNIFTEHPHAIGETYFAHLLFAAWLAFNALFAGIIFTVHAFLPFLFKTTGSEIVVKMNEKILIRLSKKRDIFQ